MTAGSVHAQDGPPAPGPQAAPRQSSDDIDVENGPDRASVGPSILSRDAGLVGQRGGKLIDLRLYGEITGIYDSALAPVPAANGPVVVVPDHGIDSGAGLIGTRVWRHAQISLEYKGTFRQYARDSLLNGSDQFLDLTYSQFLSPHAGLDVRAIAGTTTMPNGEFTYLPLANTDFFALPRNDLFNDRKNYAQARIAFVWQKTRRLSFDIGGEGFLVRRQYMALAGLNGYSARAGVAYRLTEHQTIGAVVQQTHFDFQRLFGNAELQTAALEYSIALSRTLDLAVQFGGTRLNTSGLMQVSLDPAVASIIGQNLAIVTFTHINYVPAAGARLTRRFSHSSLVLEYSSGVSPGNELYLTSRQTSARAAFSYTGAHRLAAAVSAGYSQLTALDQTLPLYGNLEGGGGLTYRISGDTYIELRYDYRHFTTQNHVYNLDSNRLSLGLAFSPGAAPLAIW